MKMILGVIACLCATSIYAGQDPLSMDDLDPVEKAIPTVVHTPFVETVLPKRTVKPITDAEKEKIALKEKVFKVTKGTLKENALRLAKKFKYKPYGWDAKNFMIDIPYSFQYENIDQAFTVLFNGYPVQAQLIDTGVIGESAVSFVTRRMAMESEK